MSNHSLFLILLPLILSAFTHLWNPTNFPIPDVDENIYLGRAVRFIDTFNPNDSHYDHPYFGQIFLAGFLYITGYQNLLNSENMNFEMLFLVPRIFIGILAVVDTFLIFKIGELYYSRKVGFIASILFAVMPLTLLTRWIHLDSLQLPLTLLSILFAIVYFRRPKVNAGLDNKDIVLVLLSGIFLGLSIFTKIPSLTIIPLVGYLVFTRSQRNFKVLGIWFIPVLLMPLIWPMHSIIVGEFNQWLDGINAQTHRDPRPLDITLSTWLSDHPFLFIFGLAGLIYAVIKKDLFLVLGIIPFLVFIYFINRVVSFHLLYLIVILCISTSRLFVDTTYYVDKISKDKLLRRLCLGGVSVVLAFGITFGFVDTISHITQDQSSQYFMAASFVEQYLKDNNLMQINAKGHHNNNNNNNITVISDPFFTWIQKYKFHNDNFIPYILVPEDLMLKTEKVISIIDRNFRQELEIGANLGIRLEKLISSFDTEKLATFKNNSSKANYIDVLVSDLDRPNRTKTDVVNILDKDSNDWIKSRYVDIQSGPGAINITVNTKNATKNNIDNNAFLRTPVNLGKSTTFLFISYLTKSDNANADFVIAIRDINNALLLWKPLLNDTEGRFQPELIAFGKDTTEKQVKLEVKIRSNDKGVHVLAFNNFSLIN